jgi:hypothetical protein
MHSSSSSDESFLNLGAIPDTLDPFSRFWGMLENMLDDISNPVAFASAPLGIHADGPVPLSRLPNSTVSGSDKRATGKQKERESRRTKEKGTPGSELPADGRTCSRSFPRRIVLRRPPRERLWPLISALHFGHATPAAYQRQWEDTGRARAGE